MRYLRREFVNRTLVVSLLVTTFVLVILLGAAVTSVGDIEPSWAPPEIYKYATKPALWVGDTITFLITVRNPPDPPPGYGVVVTWYDVAVSDVVSDSLSIIGYSIPDWQGQEPTITVTGNTVTATAAFMDPGDWFVLQIDCELVGPIDAGTYLTNRASVVYYEDEAGDVGIAYDSDEVLIFVGHRLMLPLIMRNSSVTPPSPTPIPSAFVSDVAVNPETNRVYVASPPSNAVFAVDPTVARGVVATIGVGSHPVGLDVVTTTNKIYAANLYSHSVTAIDGDTHTRITDIVVGVEAAKVVADSADRRVYVTHHKEIDNGAAAIDSEADILLYYYERLHGTQGRYGIDLDPARDQIFLAARDAGLVAIQAAYHPEWDPQIFKLDPPRVPYVVAFNPATQHLFITAKDLTTPDHDWVVVLDPYAIEWDRGRWMLTRDGVLAFLLTQTNAGWLTEIPVGSGAEEGIDVNPLTGLVYVTNADDDTVSVLQDAATAGGIHWVQDIPVGDFPQGVAVDPSRNKIYVGNAWSRDLSVIDGGSATVSLTIPLD